MDRPIQTDAIDVITADAGMNNLLTELHNQTFDDAADKWSSDDFGRILALQTTHALLLVRECEDIQTPAGFVVFSHAADECEILMIGIIPEWRRHGLGSILIKKVVRYACKSGIRQIFLEVREDNGPAISLYKSHNFLIIGRRKHYYRQSDNSFIDAIAMKRVINI